MKKNNDLLFQEYDFSEERKRKIAFTKDITTWMIIAIIISVFINLRLGYYITSALLVLTQIFLFYIFKNREKLKSPILILTYIAILFVAAMMLTKHGTHNAIIVYFPAIIFVAGLELNRKSLVIATAFSITIIWTIGILELSKVFQNEFSNRTHFPYLITLTIILLITGLVTDKLCGDYLNNLKRLKTNAKLLQKANDELKNINISKSKFYSLLTHDLKSPFQGLLGYANFITQEFYVLTDREKFELISKLNTAIKTQFEFLEQLVIWGKYQSSNNVQVLDACNGKDIINRVLNIYSPLASQKKITINTECNDCEELFIDEDIIKMILRNLVSNAIKFTPVEGKIDLTLKKENDVLTIVVSDTGVGISEDKLVILFNNNSGFTTRGTQEESGHGLGLMMCSEVVQKLDGKILVESTIGSGTTFTVSIPLKDKNPNTAKS